MSKSFYIGVCVELPRVYFMAAQTDFSSCQRILREKISQQKLGGKTYIFDLHKNGWEIGFGEWLLEEFDLEWCASQELIFGLLKHIEAIIDVELASRRARETH